MHSRKFKQFTAAKNHVAPSGVNDGARSETNVGPEKRASLQQLPVIRNRLIVIYPEARKAGAESCG